MISISPLLKITDLLLSGSQGLMRPIQIDGWTYFRTFIFSCGVASSASTHAVPSGPGSIALRTMLPFRNVLRERRSLSSHVSLEEFEMLPDKDRADLIVTSAEIRSGEITGLSPGNVAMRIHRIKNILARRFREGGRQAG